MRVPARLLAVASATCCLIAALLVATAAPAYAAPAIYLDGVRVATVNQWSSTLLARQPLYLRNGLSLSRSHVLEVRLLGTAGHTGGGTRVAIDAATILR